MANGPNASPTPMPSPATLQLNSKELDATLPEALGATIALVREHSDLSAQQRVPQPSSIDGTNFVDRQDQAEIGIGPGAIHQPTLSPSRAVQFIERTDYLGNKKRYFPMEEIARHNTREDCWLIAHGKVYDVTTFIRLHPAGESAIYRHGGKDATEDFEFHHKASQKMWTPYMIGYVLKDDACTIS